LKDESGQLYDECGKKSINACERTANQLLCPQQGKLGVSCHEIEDEINGRSLAFIVHKKRNTNELKW
jgi:hypothetical protein